ncbi:MAG TPA: glycosyltransferase family 4 protein [Pirellulales bacterium]|jgi:glycosyltransferase involved in cell wall biosynthesis|nr:glycosyltransferase family 4 protein [Pirellulales bacterium]
MKIVYLAAGAAGMYCGSCLHDNTLAAALHEQGEEILLAPTYTPLRTDEPNMSDPPPIFYGGINVYLEEKIPVFRWLPEWSVRWLDSPRLLKRLSKMNFAVRAEKLGPLTLSILRGEEGHQRRELERLVAWLRDEVRPDVVHLSNSMLAGLANRISVEVEVPVVCTLSGEDLFIERLPPRWYGRVREELRRRAKDIARFVALNDYYAEFMADYLNVDRAKITVIPHGLKLAGHGTRAARAAEQPPRIGYFARIAPEKGLHHLVDAFKLLAEDASLPLVRLAIAGYLNSGDRRYFDEQQARLAEWGLAERVDYHGEVSRDEKIAFLQSLDVMALPTVYRESKGLPMLEALANAVPVVVPSHGTFPELVADTGGGELFEPGNVTELAGVLRQLISDPQRNDELGRRGQQAVHDRYHDRLMAERHRALYAQVVEEYDRLSTIVPDTVRAPSPEPA